MQIKTLDHVNIETDDVDRSARFYEKVLGMKSGERPNFGRPGHWMYLNGRPIVHIITRSADNAMLTGSKDAAISHFALEIGDIDDAKAHLDANGVDYQEVGVPGTPMRQLFLSDPDGVLVELLHIPQGAR